MKLSDLSGNPRNPRKITDQKLEMLKKALAEFGDLSGIVFNRRTQQLVGGHQRLKALPRDAELVREQEYAEPTRTGTVAEGYAVIDGERFKYREVDWDDTREKAANIAANKHGGEFDLPILSEWLLELDAMNIDMDLTGFDADELEDLMAPVEQVEGLTDEDSVPEVQAEPITKRGDIYQLGRHRLMCGDSTSIDDVEKLMDGEKADMVYTDPPYGMFLDTDFSSMDGLSPDGKSFLGTRGGKIHKQVAGDHEDFKPDLINTVFAAFPDAKEVFLWGADYYAELLPNRNDGAWIVWDKRTNEGASLEQAHSADKLFGSNFELCWSKSKHKREIARIRNGIFGVKNESGNSATVHPTQKPVQLAEWFFEKWGSGLSVVADLYGGSGSTLIACEKTGRQARLVELDPHYCDVIVARWEKFTGQKAQLLTAEVPNS